MEDDDPKELGLSRAALLHVWFEAWFEVELLANPGDGDSEALSMAAVLRIDEWFPRFPGCRSILSRHWLRYVEAMAAAVVDELREPRDPSSAGGAMQHALESGQDFVDVLETVVTARSDGEGLFSLEEQEWVHLRYRFGLPVPGIAYVMGISVERATKIGRGVNSKLRPIIQAIFEGGHDEDAGA